MAQMQCPNCTGYKVKRYGPNNPVGMLLFGAVGVIGGLITMTNGNGGAIVAIIAGVVFLIWGFQSIITTTKVVCQICGYKWDTRNQ
jgi:uncharacterized membrane protein HdeD (DUF308 family)